MARTLRDATTLLILLVGMAFPSQAFAQAWDLAVDKSGPSQVAPGDTITYSIGLANFGPDDATGVTLTDSVPAGATFVSFSQGAGPAFTCTTPAVGGGGTISCTIATLVAGATAGFTLVIDTNAVANGTLLTNIASVTSPADINGDNDAATAVTAVGVFADVEVSKSGTPSVLDSGGPISYGITLINNGPDAAQSVSLTDTIPAGTTFAAFAQGSGPAFTCTTPPVGAGGTITCTIATLSAGASASFTLTVNAGPGTLGNTITNTASASTTTADTDPSNDSGSAFTVIVAAAADLALTKTGPASVVAGANVSYSIGLTNNGPQAAQSTVLTDTVPAGTTFVSLAAAAGFTCTTPAVGATGTVTCNIASLPSGSTAAFTLVVQSSAAGAGTTITNTASASTATADPNPGDNSATAVTPVVAPAADLAVTKTAPASVIAGSNVSYAIGLTNNGPQPAQSTALTDTLPAGTTFVSLAQGSGPAFTCTTPAVGATGTVTCTNAALASGTTASFTLVVQSSAGSVGATISNTASATTSTADPNPGNNSATASTLLAAATADLAVTKTAPASVTAGANISYNIVLSNSGPSSALSTALSDALPAGTTFVSLSQTSGPAFTCTTPAVGAAGTVTCNIASLAAASSAAFTLVARAGSGTGGTTIANTASASSTTADPTPGNNSATASTSSMSAQTFSGASATGSGTITVTFTGGGAGCSFATAQFIPVTGNARSPPAGSAPAGVTFPHGLFDFTTSGCTAASTLAFTIVYPTALPPGTLYWKYGPRPGIPTAQWYVLPGAVNGNTATFTITDGGLGDDDLAANGAIVDQGGPGVPGAGATEVPTLSEWAQLLLAMLVAGLGIAALRRKPARVRPRS